MNLRFRPTGIVNVTTVTGQCATGGYLEPVQVRRPQPSALAVEVAYLAVLTRAPTPAEAAHFEAKLAGTSGEPRRAALADLYWVLLNTTEFAWSH